MRGIVAASLVFVVLAPGCIYAWHAAAHGLNTRDDCSICRTSGSVRDTLPAEAFDCGALCLPRLWLGVIAPCVPKAELFQAPPPARAPPLSC